MVRLSEFGTGNKEMKKTEYEAYCDYIWKTCLASFQQSILLALAFAEKGEYLEYQGRIPAKEEFAVNSRYMHRGYYCPSPIFEQVVTNARRGKLLKRPTKRSNITNRYCFGEDHKLYFVEYLLNQTVQSREYIMQMDNVRYGFVFNAKDVLGGISVETYCQNKLQSYMWVMCHNASSTGQNWQTNYVRYETYEYDGQELICANFHHVALIEDEYHQPSDATHLVDLYQYCKTGDEPLT